MLFDGGSKFALAKSAQVNLVFELSGIQSKVTFQCRHYNSYRDKESW